jgi:hypothetical protein
MSPDDFQAAREVLDDTRRLIAAGKVQRWEAVKWAVTVNFALATASIALMKEQHAGWFLALAIFVALLGALFVLEINCRMTKTRADGNVTQTYLSRNGIDFLAITGREAEQPASFWYDRQDLAILAGILVLSVVPAFYVVFF